MGMFCASWDRKVPFQRPKHWGQCSDVSVGLSPLVCTCRPHGGVLFQNCGWCGPVGAVTRALLGPHACGDSCSGATCSSLAPGLCGHSEAWVQSGRDLC